MGLGTKAYLVGAILTCYSSFAAALGLGEIKLNSALNQPLDADIRLLHVRDLSERELLIGLASSEEFARAGVDRSYFLTDLKFEVNFAAAGGPVIHVSSETPIREPFINFLLVAQWPSGKLLREYTLLVDLPVFSGAKAAPVNTASREQNSASTVRSSSSSTPAKVVSRPSTQNAQSSFSGAEYGPVGANENLWSIASKVRPDSSVSVQQTMLALQKLNPDAFINNNINLLRRGQVLRVPDKNEIQTLNAREAIREVADQNRRWSDKSTNQAETSAQLEGSKNFNSTRSESNVPEGRIKLSSGDQAATSGGAGSGEDESGTRVLENALAVTQEELDAASRENADLKSRLSSVEEQIKTMEKLVEVSSEEMRALELAAKQTNSQSDPATLDGSDDEAAANDSLDSEAAAVEDAAQESMSDTDKPAPKTPAIQTSPSEKPSIIDLLMDNLLYVAIGIGALIAALAGFFFMRRRDDDFDDDYEDDFSVDYDKEYEPEITAPMPDEAEDATIRPHQETEQLDMGKELELSHEAETEDVVGECDIHIAYGQYEQAEEKLTSALEREPSNIAMRLKLLEVFAGQGDVASFDNHFAKIHLLGDSQAIARASMLRDGMETSEPFDLAAQDTSDFEGRMAGRFESTDTQIANFNDEGTADEDLNLGDDTLKFDFENVDDLVESSDDELTVIDDGELELDLSDLDVSLEGDDDLTLIPSSGAVDNLEDHSFGSDEEILDYDSLNEESDDTVIAQAVTEEDEHDLDLHNELESSLDAIEDSFSVENENEVTLETPQNSSSSDDLGDLDFDLDDIDTDMSFEDVELELDTDSFERFSSSSDEMGDSEALSLSEKDNGSEDLIVPTDFSLDLDDENKEDDNLSAEVDIDSNLVEDAEAESVTGNTGQTIPEDFDLDEDIDAGEGPKTELAGIDSELEDMDFGDLDDLDIDIDQIDGGETSAFEAADEGTEEPLTDLAGKNVDDELEAELPAFELEPTDKVSERAESTLNEEDDFSLGSDVDLDNLDEDLDSLTSEFEKDLASTDALMDEPITEFDDFNLDDGDELNELPSAGLSEEVEEDSQLGNAASLVDEDDASVSVNDTSSVEKSSSSKEFEIPDFDPENDDDSNLDFLSDNDETATKLDLARAYIDMGDAEGAKDILDEIAEEGNEQQKQEAESLLARLA